MITFILNKIDRRIKGTWNHWQTWSAV